MIVTLTYCYRRPIGRRTGIEHFSQGEAAGESAFAYGGDAAGDDDRGQGGAIAESLIVYGGDTAGDGD